MKRRYAPPPPLCIGYGGPRLLRASPRVFLVPYSADIYAMTMHPSTPFRQVMAAHGFFVLVPEIYHEYLPPGIALPYNGAYDGVSGVDVGNNLKVRLLILSIYLSIYLFMGGYS